MARLRFCGGLAIKKLSEIGALDKLNIKDSRPEHHNVQRPMRLLGLRTRSQSASCTKSISMLLDLVGTFLSTTVEIEMLLYGTKGTY